MSEQLSEPAWLTADIMFEGGDWSSFGTAAEIDTLVTDAVAQLWREVPSPGTAPAVATIVFETDAAVRDLNKRYRGIDKPTNVLSFPAAPLPAGVVLAPDELRHIGDVIFALETVRHEAADLDIRVTHHLQHLTVHGLLHLLGFDHQTEDDAQTMESLETRILARLGIPDPYANSDPLPP